MRRGLFLRLKCPNDRYLNDEAVCQAIVSMLAQVGIEGRTRCHARADLLAGTARGFNFDMPILLGWSPGTFDAEHPIRFLVTTPDGNLGTWNFGGFSNDRIDELLPQIQSEIDDTARQGMLDEAAGIIQEQMAYVPLYVQPLVWGAGENIDLVQRPDDFFILRWVRVN